MKGQKKYKYEISAPSGKKVFRLFVAVVLSNLQIATTMVNVAKNDAWCLFGEKQLAVGPIGIDLTLFHLRLCHQCIATNLARIDMYRLLSNHSK